MFEQQGYKKPTLAIYGIQDISENPHPEYVHDHNLTLFYDGEIKSYLHLERLTRKKFDNKLHHHIYEILNTEGISKIKEIDLVFVDNILGASFISKKGDIRFELTQPQKPATLPYNGMVRWYGKSFPAFGISHELAHVYSNMPFYGHFKENSLHVHFDGGASKSNMSIWQYHNQQLKLLQYHWDYKYLSSLYNANPISFGITGESLKTQNSVAGKFMGFASYGTYNKAIDKWLREHNFFSDFWGRKSTVFQQINNRFKEKITHYDLNNPFIQDLAATMQGIFERDFIKLLEKLQEKYQADYLYYSGGSALNIPLNSKLIKSKLFKDLFIPPCANDSGLSIGAGAFIETYKGNKIQKQSVYLPNQSTCKYVTEYNENQIANIAERIFSGEIIGVCNGFGECGPRALGNRSIIGLPDKETARQISMLVKGREWYRPVAPVMLKHNVKKIITSPELHHLSRYMLLEYTIKDTYKKEMEGVVHVNNTARIQTIFERSDNPFLYDLLIFLDKKYHIKALVNTSFNFKGEPIIMTEKDALVSAKKMHLDGLILNGIYHSLS